MSDDIVRTLLESLSPEQKKQLIEGILDSNVKGDKPPIKEEVVSSEPRSNVNEDFSVSNSNNLLDSKKVPVKFKKNNWVDDGEFRADNVDYDKFEKSKTPRRRGRPKKTDVECHVCGKTFSVNASLVYGEYMRGNRCTGR